MSAPHRFPDRGEIEEALELVVGAARGYFREVDRRPVLSPRLAEALAAFRGPLPQQGDGAAEALRRLIADGPDASATTSGPRCFHFVIGGVTPAAMAADILATVLDQPAYAWISSPLGVELEQICLGWLRELFGLAPTGAGVFTTGATMANFVGLASARQWWAERHGVDVSEEGWGRLPQVPLFSSGYIHASAVKCCALLGMGRTSVRRFTRDSVGRLDLAALEAGLRSLGGAPAILVANAGEVNAGEFDPIAAMADLAEKYGAWLHVDGAFGLFAGVSERTRHLTAGVERAQSVCVDGHKWLNVPYDCGFAFVQDVGLMAKAFAYTAAYLPSPDDPRPTLGAIGPESSRQSRSLAVWATLRAYGRDGYRALVERHLDLAQELAARVDAAPDLERLAEVPLNIVCFRFNPGGLAPAALDALNRELGAALLADGRVYAGTTLHDGRVALRPAIVNWRTGSEEIAELVAVVREIGQKLQARPAPAA